MKAIVCELCGSNNLVKQDGMYVCQHCGTTYSPEEAKKLMMDVSGSTVKIDNSAFVKKYLENARRAKRKEDWKETEKYYNMVEQNDPTNIEAIFYSSFAQLKSALVEAETKDKRQSVFNILIKGVSIIDDNFDNANEEHHKLLPVIMNDIKGLKNGTIVPTTHLQDYVTKNGYGNVVGRDQVVENDSLDVTYKMIDGVVLAYMDSLANIIVEYSPESAKKVFMDNISFLPLSSEIHEKVAPHIDGYITPQQAAVEIAKQVKLDVQTTKYDLSNQIAALGKKICPMYVTESLINNPLENMVREELRKTNPNAKALKKGCYVATAVYGSYDCPQVWTLRRYRDDTLAKTWYGRAFIHTYYAISPTLVKWFGSTDWFRNMWKPKLDRMVSNLNSEGVEDTPYEDKQWK